MKFTDLPLASTLQRAAKHELKFFDKMMDMKNHNPVIETLDVDSSGDIISQCTLSNLVSIKPYFDDGVYVCYHRLDDVIYELTWGIGDANPVILYMLYGTVPE